MGSPQECDVCTAPRPPVGSGLDRLAELFERAGTPTPVAVMVPLDAVLAAEALRDLPAIVADFYADPTRFRVRARLTAGAFSRLLLRGFAAISRQSLPVQHGAELGEFAVCQWLYADARGHVHWDRYACVDGRCERLFVARIGFARGRIRETFIIYGLPITISFRADVEHQALVLTSVKTLHNPLSWFTRVTYRTERLGEEVVTHGDLRVPVGGLRVRTEFRIAPQ